LRLTESASLERCEGFLDASKFRRKSAMLANGSCPALLRLGQLTFAGLGLQCEEPPEFLWRTESRSQEKHVDPDEPDEIRRAGTHARAVIPEPSISHGPHLDADLRYERNSSIGY
jgi:hypothetical protein